MSLRKETSRNNVGTLEMTEEVRQKRPKRELLLGAVSIIFALVLSAIAIYYKEDLMKVAAIANYSLLGIFILSFLAGSLLSMTAVPVPYWLFVFTLPAVLAPRWGMMAPVSVGITSAFGATLGHLPTFMIGYGGSRLTEIVTQRVTHRLYHRAVNWARRHGAWASFLTSAMFNPFHLPMTVAIGALRFPPPKYFFFSLLGNCVKSLLLAFAGYYGLNSLSRLLGI
ncbi:MAG: VTT domain-containing protein [Chloroflexi bacterium]|nr:VTT domain-containing protein [Chloroflexota bacterium]